VNFIHPYALIWLWVALALAALGVWAARRAARRRRALLGSQARRLAPAFSAPRRILRDGLAASAVLLCIGGLAGPQVGTWMRDVTQRGVDIQIVLDTSRSMLAQDLSPNRLERARREVIGLLGVLRGDRVGLVTFAGDARQITPLTADPTSYRLFLQDVDTNTNALGGTAVGEGLELALDGFDPETPAARVILLLTDGEDHMSDPTPDEVAYRAMAMGVPIHVVSFGARDGGEIPVVDHRGRREVVRDETGQPVISIPNEALLERIAGISGGSYLSAERTPFPLDEIWAKRISQMEGVTRASSTRLEHVNRYQWALVAALLCLGCRALMAEGRPVVEVRR
jgi:Ca-activated chloride channel family protein